MRLIETDITRRRWTQIAAGAAFAACTPAQEASPLIDSAKGNFQFLRGSGPYSSGAVASPGFEIVHAIFNPLPELWDAFGVIERHLGTAGRPIDALCGMELRIPEPLSVEGFDEFNQPYIDRLKEWGTHVDGMNPIARTNVAFEVSPVTQPSVYGFCYTVPSDAENKTFVIAGAGEIQGSLADEDGIVSRGDVSEAGLRAKGERVMNIMAERLEAMEVDPNAVTQSNVYSIHNIHPLVGSIILPVLNEGARHGVRWHYARPPVLEVEFEMDMRGVNREIIVAG